MIRRRTRLLAILLTVFALCFGGPLTTPLPESPRGDGHMDFAGFG
jgi:hypothetical protein